MITFKKGDKVRWCPLPATSELYQTVGRNGVIKSLKNDAVALVDFDGDQAVPVFTAELRKCDEHD